MGDDEWNQRQDRGKDERENQSLSLFITPDQACGRFLSYAFLHLFSNVMIYSYTSVVWRMTGCGLLCCASESANVAFSGEHPTN